MADKFNKRVLFNDGEGLVETDLNELQDQIHAEIADATIGTKCLLEPSASEPDAGYCYASGNGCAPYGDPFTNDTIFFAPGMIYVVAPGSSIDGDTPSLVGHYVDYADIPVPVRPLATTTARWDILTVSLAVSTGGAVSRDFKDATTGALTTITPDKEKKSVATFTWTQGTEGGGEPATPAGDVKICAIQVPIATAAFTVVGGLIRDYRVPIGYTTYIQQAATFLSSVTAGTPTYTPAFDIANIAAGGGSDSILVGTACPVSSELHRLARLELFAPTVAGAGNTLALAGSTDTSVITTLLAPATGDVIVYIMQTGAVPVWSNGYTAGYAAELEGLRPRGLSMLWTSTGGGNSATLKAVRWHLFGGS